MQVNGSILRILMKDPKRRKRARSTHSRARGFWLDTLLTEQFAREFGEPPARRV